MRFASVFLWSEDTVTDDCGFLCLMHSMPFIAKLTVSSLWRLQNSTQKVKKWFSGLRKTACRQSLCSSPDQTGSQRTTVRTRCSRITSPSHVMKQCFSSDESFFKKKIKFLLQVSSCHQWSTLTRASHVTSWSWTAKRSKKWVEHTLVPSCRRTCTDISSHMHKTRVSQGVPFFLVSL